jgi:multidrug efflux pump subunit AcrA (membrane-fusion protein)
VEQDQVVQPGQVLFRADGTDASEVTAWLPLRGVRRVLATSTAPLDALTDADALIERFGLEARIRIGTGARGFGWDAEVVRVRGVDSQTRALGLDVAVRDPYGAIVPGEKPPLVPDLYVEVEIRAPARPAQVVIPRSAIHHDRVYVADADRRLRLRPVRIAFVQEEFAVVREGLAGGETLVLTDLVPAVEGELLDPRPDDAARDALLRAAAGESSER